MSSEAPATVSPMVAMFALEPSLSLIDGVMEGGREAGTASCSRAFTSSPWWMGGHDMGVLVYVSITV